MAENHALLKDKAFEMSLYNEEEIIHKLSHQHLYTKFWIVKVDGCLVNGISIKKIRNYAVPILIGNFIESFNFD
jgi:A/G-specific adenine glycosylase